MMVGRVIIVLALLILPGSAAAEIIDSFESDITVQNDGTLSIVETIRYDFGNEERHGIFRYVPFEHTERASTWYKKRVIDVEFLQIERNGNEEPFVVSIENGYASVRIGREDVTITGPHTYRIEYILRGALMYPKQLPPEVYLDVNGVGWDVPIKVVRATLRGSGLMNERSCYTGVVGSGASCSVRPQADGSVLFEATSLAPNETMTIANALSIGSIEKNMIEEYRLDLISLVIAPLWLICFFVYVYLYRTAHKSGRTIIAQYEPYPGVLPMQMGVLKDGSLDPKDIAAAIVYLAEQGHLLVRKTERKVLFFFEVDDFEIELVKQLPDGGPKSHREIITLLFHEGAPNGSVVSLSALKSDTSKQRDNYALVQSLEKAIIEDLTKTGFYELSGNQTHTFMWMLWGIAGALFIGLFVVTPSIAHIVTLITATISAIIAHYMTRRLTVKGYEALWHTRGFREYLSVAEKDRLDFHNAPERKPEQFFAFLPYAIALGVEEKWAEAFKDITIPEPSWYQGGGSTAFSASNLSTSLGGFSSALASSAGSSASSGGGSAGGGTGGGGGGSW